MSLIQIISSLKKKDIFASRVLYVNIINLKWINTLAASVVITAIMTT